MTSRIAIGGLLAGALLTSCGRETIDARAVDDPAAGLVSGIPFYREVGGGPEWLDPESPEADAHRLAPFALTDQTGAMVTRETLAGRVSVTSFFFTRCGDLCPTLRSNLTRVQDEFLAEDDVLLLSISVTPDADTPEVLARYAATNGIVAAKWRLLTGDRDEIRELARDSWLVELTDGARHGVDSLAHTETVVVADGEGRIRGLYDGSLRLEVDRLIEDVHALLEPEVSVIARRAGTS
jgi:protein SCO1/2